MVGFAFAWRLTHALIERETDDLGRLGELARKERYADRRDRLRAAMLAIERAEPGVRAMLGARLPRRGDRGDRACASPGQAADAAPRPAR